MPKEFAVAAPAPVGALGEGLFELNRFGGTIASRDDPPGQELWGGGGLSLSRAACR